MKKNNGGAIARLIVWSVVLVLTLSALVTGLAGVPFQIDNVHFSLSDRYTFHESDYNRGGGKVSSAVENLEIQWVSGSVTVKPYEGTTILLEETGGVTIDEQMRWKAENGTLRIFPRKSFWYIGFISLPEKDLTVYLPQGLILQSLEISTVSGKVALEQFSCPDATVETVSGAIGCLGCDLAALDCTTVSGKLTFNGATQEIAWESVSGDAELTTSAMPRKIESDTVSGNFTVSMPDGPGFTAVLDGVSAGLQSDFLWTASGSSFRYGDGSGRFEFDSVSGNVHLKKH